MDYLRRISPKNRFLRGMFILVGGTAGGQIIAFLVAPILTRLYQPADFGVLSVYLALAAIVSVTAGLQYPSAIVLPEKDEEADAVLLLSVSLVLAIVGFTVITLLFFSEDIARLLNTSALIDYLYLLPISVFFIGIYRCFSLLAIREKAFATIANTRMTQPAAIAAIQFGGAYFGMNTLLVGQVAGHAAGSVLLILRMLGRRWHQLKQVRLVTVLHVAYEYRRLPLFETWTGLFNVIGGQLPSILLAMLYGPAAAGMYALTSRVLYVPVQLFSQAVSEVFCSRAAELNREGNLAVSTAEVHSKLTHFAIPPVLVMVVSAPELFSAIFGPDWRQAGVFAQWLAPWLYFVLITSPLTMVFTVLGKQGIALMFELSSLCVRAAAIIIGAYVGDVVTAIALLASGSILTRGGMLLCLLRISGNPWRKVWQPPFSALLWSVLLVSPTLLNKIHAMGSTIGLATFGASGFFILARYAYLMKRGWA